MYLKDRSQVLKNWINKKMEMTPNVRLSISYWLATFQAITVMTFLQDVSYPDTSSGIHWSVFLGVWIVIGILYIRNTIAFKKETLWMTIKNPAKVTREEDDLMTRHPTGQLPYGMHPPPPPNPPVPHHKRTYTNGTAWPPKPTLPPNKSVGP